MQIAFRQCLATLDIAMARSAWSASFPAYPPLGSDEDVLAMLHYARTSASSSPLKDRAYSHRWLTERTLPSGLPDNLKQSADRLYPAKVGVVGIATKTRSKLAADIRNAMEDAVHETYADGHANQPDVVHARMMEMRQRVLRG